MGKSLIYLFLFFLLSCSTKKMSSGNLNAILKNPIYSSSKEMIICSEDNYQEQVDTLNSNLRTSKNKIKILNDLGNCLSMANQYSLAIYYYELALSNPDLTREQKSLIYSNVANIYLLTNNAELAFKNLELSIKLNPANGNALAKIGILAFQRGDFPLSHSYLSKAVTHGPNNPELTDYFGAVSFMVKDAATIENKVLVKINDKSSERYQIFDCAKRLLIKPKQEDILKVKSIAVNSQSLTTLKKYILEYHYEKIGL